MSFRKILCATDFSDGARRAFDIAVRLAAHDGAELVVTHAWQLPMIPGEFGPAPDVIQQSVDDDKRLLDAAVQLATERGVKHASGRHVSGVAWSAIVGLAADDPEIDLVVVGTHGRTGIRRVLLGSVAEKVVRLSPVSVLAVHPDDRVGAFRKLLCPTDFSASAEQAESLAAALVETGDSVLELVHYIDVSAAVRRDPRAAEIERDLLQQAAVNLAREATGLGRAQSVLRRCELGNPGERLLDLLARETYDLVVTGSHGRTGLARVMTGSVAEKLVRHARCPVLVTRVRT